MRLSRIRSYFYKAARLLGDVSAIQHHRVGRRIRNRIVGRAFGRLLRKVL